jgi:hypothetical protein
VTRRFPKRTRAYASAFALAAAACVPPTAPADDAPLTPPFAVSDHFAPTGYMGDGTTVGVVTMTAAACPSRAPGAVGDCYQIVYTPPSPSMNGWAGVYWQYPGNNWGAYPGHTVRPGATKATVWAMGAHGGEQVQFKVGGISNGTYQDSITAASTSPATLTTTWQSFEVDFAGATYSEVLGGFAWIVNLPPPSAGAQDTTPITFYLDGIEWTP